MSSNKVRDRVRRVVMRLLRRAVVWTATGRPDWRVTLRRRDDDWQAVAVPTNPEARYTVLLDQLVSLSEQINGLDAEYGPSGAGDVGEVIGPALVVAGVFSGYDLELNLLPARPVPTSVCGLRPSVN